MIYFPISLLLSILNRKKANFNFLVFTQFSNFTSTRGVYQLMKKDHENMMTNQRGRLVTIFIVLRLLVKCLDMENTQENMTLKIIITVQQTPKLIHSLKANFCLSFISLKIKSI